MKVSTILSLLRFTEQNLSNLIENEITRFINLFAHLISPPRFIVTTPYSFIDKIRLERVKTNN